MEVKGSAGRDRERIDPRKRGPLPRGPSLDRDLQEFGVCKGPWASRRGARAARSLEPRLPKRLASSRGQSLEGQPAREQRSLAAGERTRLSGHGHAGGDSYRNLSGKRPFDFSPVWGEGGAEGARSAAARGQRAARRGEGRGGPEHNFPGRLCERRRSLLALQPSQ